MTGTTSDHQQAGRRRAGPLALTGWVLFDWASQPFYTLITTFLFAPYFVNVFIANPAEGQALWGYTTAMSGLLVALISPLLGATADGQGRLKPWIAAFSAVFLVAQAALWLAVPNPGDPLLILLVMGVIVLAAVTAEFATVFTNALMPFLVPPEGLGRLSGTGWAVGYAGGLASLVLMAGLIMTQPDSGRTLLGLAPILSLDPAAAEAERLIGPFSALWYGLFVLPLFLFTPDIPPRARRGGTSLRQGFESLVATLANVRGYRPIVLFLIARMLYVDGLSAIFTFGGIYAAVVFGWQSVMLGYFGIVLTVTAAMGAFAGGFVDDRLGAKPTIMGALLVLMVGLIGVLSVDKSHVLFLFEVAPREPGAGPFASAGEQVYLAFAVLIGLAAGPLQAASRSLLARMAPPAHMTEFFGLYAFSGKITAFLAPLLVGMITDFTGNIRGGIAVILVLLAAGLVLMAMVQVERQADKAA